jgi:hypothetical protein
MAAKYSSSLSMMKVHVVICGMLMVQAPPEAVFSPASDKPRDGPTGSNGSGVALLFVTQHQGKYVIVLLENLISLWLYKQNIKLQD